jgi:hypothetical protein
LCAFSHSAVLQTILPEVAWNEDLNVCTHSSTSFPLIWIQVQVK